MMKTVLIVEDNVRSMEMLVKIIENLRTGVEIKTAPVRKRPPFWQ